MPDESNANRLAKVEALYNQGLKHAAAQLSRLVLEKDPANIEALVWLAKSASQADEADKATRRASTLQPDNPLVRDLVASRQPASQPSYAGAAAYNPYAVPSTGFNSGPEANSSPQSWSAFNQNQPPANSNFAPNPLTGFTAPPPPTSSSFDYLKNLSATVQPSVPPAMPVGKVNVKSSPSAAGLIFGLLFLIVGLGVAVYWTLQIFGYASDLSQTGSQLQATIVELRTSRVTADVKGQPQRQFDVSEQVSKSLIPLISDTKTQSSLVQNQVVINVTPAGRLLSVEVLTPTRGTSNVNNGGLLGYGQAADWVVTAVGGILALVGLILLGRTLGKRRT